MYDPRKPPGGDEVSHNGSNGGSCQRKIALPNVDEERPTTTMVATTIAGENLQEKPPGMPTNLA